MKTKENKNALKEEAETLNEEPHELTEEELAQVTGGGENLSSGKPFGAIGIVINPEIMPFK